MTFHIFLRLFFLVGAIFAFLFVFLLFWNISFPFLLGYILFYALKPFSTFLEHRGLSHVLAVISVFLFCFGILALVIVFAVPAFFEEFSRIKVNIPIYTQSIQAFFTSFKTFFSSHSFLSFLFSDSFDLSTSLNSFFRSFFQSALQHAPSLISNFALFTVVIPFVTFFLLLDEQKISKSIFRLVPNRYFEISVDLLYSLERQFGLILRGMFYGISIISFASFVGLWLIGLDYPLVIGIISGFTNLIPYAGPIIGIFCAFLVALISGEPLSMYLLILLVFISVQLLDNIIVQPVIMAKSANLHPLFVLFLVLIGSSFGGVLGMLVIVPLAGLSQVIIRVIYHEMKRPDRPDFSLFRDVSEPGC